MQSATRAQEHYSAFATAKRNETRTLCVVFRKRRVRVCGSRLSPHLRQHPRQLQVRVQHRIRAPLRRQEVRRLVTLYNPQGRAERVPWPKQVFVWFGLIGKLLFGSCAKIYDTSSVIFSNAWQLTNFVALPVVKCTDTSEPVNHEK